MYAYFLGANAIGANAIAAWVVRASSFTSMSVSCGMHFQVSDRHVKGDGNHSCHKDIIVWPVPGSPSTTALVIFPASAAGESQPRHPGNVGQALTGRDWREMQDASAGTLEIEK